MECVRYALANGVTDIIDVTLAGATGNLEAIFTSEHWNTIRDSTKDHLLIVRVQM